MRPGRRGQRIEARTRGGGVVGGDRSGVDQRSGEERERESMAREREEEEEEEGGRRRRKEMRRRRRLSLLFSRPDGWREREREHTQHSSYG